VRVILVGVFHYTLYEQQEAQQLHLSPHEHASFDCFCPEQLQAEQQLQVSHFELELTFFFSDFLSQHFSLEEDELLLSHADSSDFVVFFSLHSFLSTQSCFAEQPDVAFK